MAAASRACPDGVGVQAVHGPQATIDDAVALEVGDQHPVAVGDPADREVQGVDAPPCRAGGGHDPGGVWERHAQDRRAPGGERRHHVLEIADDLIEVDAGPEDVVEPADDAHEIGLERQRRLELLLADLAHLAAADPEVRVQQRGLLAGQPSGEPVGEPAIAEPIRRRILEAFGGAVADRHVAAESDAWLAAVHAARVPQTA